MLPKLLTNIHTSALLRSYKDINNLLCRSSHTFRRRFKLANEDILHWFPGHMGRGLKQMEQQLKNVDCVIEVHDARIPLSGRNSHFKYSVIGMKPHILVLNKMDLSNLKLVDVVKRKLQKEHGIFNVIYTNCKNQKCPGVKKVIPTAIDLINSSKRYNREGETDLCIMIIGVPNVGKSSLINTLRNRLLGKANAAPVGGVAGITRSLQTRIKVSDNPPVYLLDTPGILTPNVPDIEAGMRLALCANLQDHLVGSEMIADYLLYYLNKTENLSYLSPMGLDAPVDNIGTVLTKAAIKLNKFERIRSFQGYTNRPNLVAAADYFIRLFREGKFGKVQLDYELLGDSS
ncbi:hypothetical protein B566_EDAN011847 [Ephemera danica]|nr:hypothetical protein B566_EDAN011847 [Ephemera danica]